MTAVPLYFGNLWRTEQLQKYDWQFWGEEYTDTTHFADCSIPLDSVENKFCDTGPYWFKIET